MPKSEAKPIPLPSGTVLPDCPLCRTRLTVQRIIPGRLGFEHWTLLCTSCGHIHQDVIDTLSSPHAIRDSLTL